MEDTVEVDVPDLGIVTFPSSMSREEMDSAIRSHLAKSRVSMQPVMAGAQPTPVAIPQPPDPTMAAPGAEFMSRPFDPLSESARAAKQQQLEQWGDTPLGGRIDVPTGATLGDELKLAPARVGAELANWARTPSGMTQMVLAETPVAPVVWGKWAKDMLQSGYTAAKDLPESLFNLVRGHIEQRMASVNDLHPDEQQFADLHQDDLRRVTDNLAGLAMAGFGAVAAKTAVGKTVRLDPEGLLGIKPGESAEQLIQNIGKEPYASKVTSPAALYGNVRPLEKPSEVLPSQSSGPGVLPQAQEVAAKSPVSLGHYVDLFDEEGPQGRGDLVGKTSGETRDFSDLSTTEKRRALKSMGAPTEHINALVPKVELKPSPLPTEIADTIDDHLLPDDQLDFKETPSQSDDPFAAQKNDAGAGVFMRANRESGKIEIYPKEFEKWWNEIPPEKREAAVERRLNEERVHLKTDAAAAGAFWQTLTPFQQRMFKRAYSGKASGDAQALATYTPQMWGAESMRMRLQWLMDHSTSETAEAAGAEQWKMKTIMVLDTAIEGVRRAFGSKASKQALDLIGELKGKLNAARKVVVAGGGVGPAAYNKQSIAEDDIGKSTIAKFEQERTKALEVGKQAEAEAIQTEIDQLKRDHPGTQENYFPAAFNKQQFTQAERNEIHHLNEEFARRFSSNRINNYLMDEAKDFLDDNPEYDHSLDGHLGIPNYPLKDHHAQQLLIDILSSPTRAAETGLTHLVENINKTHPDMVDEFRALAPRIFRMTNADKGALFAYEELARLGFPTDHLLYRIKNDWPDLRTEVYAKSKALGYMIDRQVHNDKYLDHELIGPAAFNKRLRAQPGQQSDLFAEPITAKGVAGFDPAERPSDPAIEHTRLTGEQLTKHLQDYLNSKIERRLTKGGETTPGEIKVAQRPNFKEFVNWANRNVGGRITADQLRDMWTDEVHKAVLNATPERLIEWAKILNPENRAGKMKWPNEGELPTAQELEKHGNQKVAEEIAKGASLADRKAIAAGWRDRADQLDQLKAANPNDPPAVQNRLDKIIRGYRARADLIEQGQFGKAEVSKKTPGGYIPAKFRRKTAFQKRVELITDIARKLINEATPRADVTRTHFDQHDIDFGNDKHVPFKAIVPLERYDSKKLTEELSQGARVSNARSISETKRLIVLKEKSPFVGKVFVVSAYPHGGGSAREMRAVDPASSGWKERPNVPLKELLRKYELHYSMLLREPVKDFIQRFDSMRAFNEHIDTADSLAKAAGYREEGLPAAEHPIEGSEGVEGEGGMFMGPESTEARLALGMARGEIARARDLPLTPREARGFHHYVTGEVGKVEGPADVITALNNLVENAKARKGKLSPDEMLAVTAVHKAARDIFENYRPKLLTEDQAYEKAIEALTKDEWWSNKDEEAFIQNAMDRFGERDVLPGPHPRPDVTRPESSARELTMRDRVPPTTLRPDQVPEGSLVEKLPPPELTHGHPGDLVPQEFLSDVESAFVKSQPTIDPATRKPVTPYNPTPWGTSTDMPAAFNKKQAQAKVKEVWQRSMEEWTRQQQRMIVGGTRGSTIKDIFRTLEGRINNGQDLSHQAADRLRVDSHTEKPDTKGMGLKERFAAIRNWHKEAAMVRAAAKHVALAKYFVREVSYAKDEMGRDVKVLGERTGAVRVSEKKLGEMANQADLGMANAEKMLSDAKNPFDKWVARKWIRNQKILQREIAYAQKWYDKSPELRETVKTFEDLMAEQRQLMADNGIDISQREFYVPGMYQGDVFTPLGISFGRVRILGKDRRKPKTFSNYAEASMAGGIGRPPYLMALPDIADLAQATISSGRRMVAKYDWANDLKELRDPATGKMVAADPVLVPARTSKFTPEELADLPEKAQHALKEKDFVKKVPSKDYVMQTLGSGRHGREIAIHADFEKFFKSALKESDFNEWGYGAAGVLGQLASVLKHGGILVGDVFHPNRLAQYAVAASGRVAGIRGLFDADFGFQGGYAAMRYTGATLENAARKGLISKNAAEWAKAEEDIGGMKMARSEIAHQFSLRGLNNVRILDTLYRDALQKVPYIGETWHSVLKPFNDLMFDRISAGLMTETAVNNLVRMHQQYPNVPWRKLMDDIVRETNIEFGNLGRQGIFRNASFRDFASTVMLAPMWQEGLWRKELTFAYRATMIPAALSAVTKGKMGRPFKGYPYFGVTGRAIMRGVAAYFAFTQLLNLMTRRQFTFQNKEDGHKWDAAIDLNGRTHWINPLGLFFEKLHDIWRLAKTKPNMAEAFFSNLENSLGPIGRAAAVAGTGNDPAGFHYTTTAGRAIGAAKQLAPIPISVGTALQAGGHALAPSVIPSTRPGDLLTRSFSNLGIKLEVGETNTQIAQRMARKYMEDEGLTKETGWMETQTDEPSYTKVRRAIISEDESGTVKAIDAMMRARPKDESYEHAVQRIGKAMKIWSTRGFTGSKEHENGFIGALDENHMEVYSDAMAEKEAIYEKFVDGMVKWLETHEE